MWARSKSAPAAPSSLRWRCTLPRFRWTIAIRRGSSSRVSARSNSVIALRGLSLEHVQQTELGAQYAACVRGATSPVASASLHRLIATSCSPVSESTYARLAAIRAARSDRRLRRSPRPLEQATGLSGGAPGRPHGHPCRAGPGLRSQPHDRARPVKDDTALHAVSTAAPAPTGASASSSEPTRAAATSPARIGALNDVPLQTAKPPRKSSGSIASRTRPKARVRATGS